MNFLKVFLVFFLFSVISFRFVLYCGLLLFSFASFVYFNFLDLQPMSLLRSMRPSLFRIVRKWFKWCVIAHDTAISLSSLSTIYQLCTMCVRLVCVGGGSLAWRVHCLHYYMIWFCFRISFDGKYENELCLWQHFTHKWPTMCTCNVQFETNYENELKKKLENKLEIDESKKNLRIWKWR